MTSNNRGNWEAVRPALGRGCLIGLGLALLFGALSYVFYLLLGMAGLAENIRLLIAIAGGPTVGTVIAFVFLSSSAVRKSREAVAQLNPNRDDETTAWD